MFILQHLDNVMSYSDYNLVSTEALSMVFAACIFYEMMQSLTSLDVSASIIPKMTLQLMIVNYSEINRRTFKRSDSSDDDDDEGGTLV